MVLAEGGSTVRLLEMVSLFSTFEQNVSVWKSVCGILHQIRTLTWPNEETANLFDQFCLNNLKPVLDHTGMMHMDPKETSNITLLR